MTTRSDDLTPAQRQSVERQSVIGRLQTALLIIVLIQVVFAGVLRALPPDIRSSLSFLHRIEWGAYAGMILIAAQMITGWAEQVVLTNRFYLLAWRFGKPRLVVGKLARYIMIAYVMALVLILGAVLRVHANGPFILAPR